MSVSQTKINLIVYTIKDLGYNISEVQDIFDNAVAAADILTKKELVRLIEESIELRGF